MNILGKTEKYDHMKLIREYAGGYKNLITLGRCLAAVSAVMTLIPYYELWKIIRTAVNGEDPDRIIGYAWMSVGLIIGALLYSRTNLTADSKFFAAVYAVHVIDCLRQSIT